MFEISLDKLLKEDKQMVKTIDKERLYGKYYKHKQSIIDFFSFLSSYGQILYFRRYRNDKE